MTNLIENWMRNLGTKLSLASMGVAVVAACSPAPMPVSQSTRDPSSPSAPEGVTPSVAASTEPTGAPMGHQGHGGATPAAADAGPQGAAYVCPMHPEVTSNQPGICPKCNMKLVPKK